jgi:hypothetical protein
MVVGETPVEWRVLVPLSFRLFGLACRLAIDSRKEGSQPDVSLPAGGVVLSVAALEAFVNEEADLTASRGSPVTAANIEATLKAREFPDRWDAFDVGFERGRLPFQAFDRLHELRNAIVHYRPYFLVPGAFPDTNRGRVLANLRNDFVLREGPDLAPWTHRYLSPGCAAWACRTARDMVRAHLELTGQAQRWDERFAAFWPLPPELEAASAPR